MGYDGSINFDTSVDTSGFNSGTGDINKQFETIRKGAESAAAGVEQLPKKIDQTAKSTSRLADIVKGGGVFKLIEKGVGAVVNSMEAAIDRYDTMNRFPKMMQQLGYGADEAHASVQKLSNGIQGLPTTLDSVVSTAQRLTILTGNLQNSVDTTLALNNAFLASGSGSEGASRGLEQYVQALGRGKFEMEEWKTLQDTMGLGLDKIAESFGFVGESAQNDLYVALKNGDITFSQFNNRLIQLSGGVGGFAELAKTSSVGIKTAWTNMGTAMVRGTTALVESLDKGLSKTRFESIQTVIESTGKAIERGMKAAAPAVELVASNMDVLIPLVATLTAAHTANAAAAALDAAMHGTLGNVLGTVAILYGALTTQGGILVVVQGLLTTVTGALAAAFNALLGPVGLVILAVGAIAAGAVAVYKAITAESAAFEEQSGILDDLAKTQESLASSEESNAKAAKDNLKSIRANADAAGELAKELGELTGIEDKSASQKQRMGAIIDQLNEKYADLCLTYDEETGKLSMTTDQLQEYIGAQQTMEEVAARQERYNELLEEEAVIRQNTAELESKQSEYASQLQQKIISQGEYNELMQQSGETLAAYATQEKALSDQRKALNAELEATDTTAAQTIINNAQAQQESARAVAEAEKAELERRKEALQNYTEAATNMFDVIDTKSEVSVNQMIANMQQNQETLAAWADNLVALGKRGLDQGLLQQLRDAGPESAATVAALVSATDAQLVTLSETFRAGGQAAANALQTELGLPEVTNAGSEMVTTMADGVASNPSLKDATVQMISDAQAAAKAQANTGGHDIGLQMSNGVAAGIAAGRGGVISAMVQTVRDAIAAAAAEAEIHSPSRVMENFIGLNLMKGWARGEEKGTNLVIDKAMAAMNAVKQAVANSTLSPARVVATMRANVIATQSRLAVPAVVGGGATLVPGQGGTIINMTNNFSTHDSLSEAEMTDQTEAMAERLRWKIP